VKGDGRKERRFGWRDDRTGETFPVTLEAPPHRTLADDMREAIAAAPITRKPGAADAAATRCEKSDRVSDAAGRATRRVGRDDQNGVRVASDGPPW